MRTISSLDELTRTVDDEPGMFLRYSAGPEQDLRNGPSQDVEAGVTMVGWSVTPLDPESWWRRSTKDWVSRRVTKYVELGRESGRRPWVLRGEIVGRGPDHEPLVADLEFVAWLDEQAVREADDHYTKAFDRGRASDEVRAG